MRIKVQGVLIELTPEQVEKIDKETKIRNEATTFIRLFNAFGFKKIAENAYHHADEGWYAEIIDHDGWKDVWAVGGGLKDSSLFPGGWTYDSPQVLAEAFINSAHNI